MLLRVNRERLLGTPTVPILVVQPTSGGDAKPYRIRQPSRIVEQYALRVKE